MAGEVRGKIYEAITAAALDAVASRVFSKASVFWHEKPDWIDIDPDFTIGRTVDKIEAVILVTHSGSEKLSEKKFWRNVGEVFQWKVQGPKPVRCYAILFESAVKPRLLIAEQTILDGTLDLATTKYGAKLKALVRKNEKAFGNSDEDRQKKVERLVDPKDSAYDSDFADCFKLLKEDLRRVLAQKRAGLEPAWTLMRAYNAKPGRVPAAKNTHVRNGLAKLMVFDKAARKNLYAALDNGGSYLDANAPAYGASLGWIEEGIEGDTVSDSDIRSAVALLGKAKCEELIASAPARMEELVRAVRAVGNVKIFHDFVVDHFDELITTAGMVKWMNACFQDPDGILNGYGDISVPPTHHWLFVFCITLEKALQNKVVAYGISKLAEDTGIPEIGQGGFIIPPFIYREKPLERSTLKAVSKVFSVKLKEIGVAKLNSGDFRKAMIEMLRQRDFYVLSTYRNYDPLLWLLQAEAKKAGLSASEVTVPSLMAVLSALNTASSHFLRVSDDTAIYWQTATSAGKVHKVKEISARFRSARVTSANNVVKERKALKNVFLLIDGEWDNADLATMARSGVVGIYYPDELTALLDAINPVRKPKAAPRIIQMPVDEDDDLAMAAEDDAPSKLKRAKRK